jgi:hypothetical protein
MSNRKNYNSIVFLTTLSVYLGLVLVGGATPSVLAQAATTRDFNIKNEIVVEDDLDKKPDGEESFLAYADALSDLYLQTKDFSEKKAAWLKDGKFEFNCSLVSVRPGGYNSSCVGELFAARFGFPLDKIAYAFPHGTEKSQVQVHLILDGETFLLKSNFYQTSKDFAEKFINSSGSILSKLKLDQAYNTKNLILQNTEIAFENNQVFIVTRLPRASIDSLPAEK